MPTLFSATPCPRLPGPTQTETRKGNEGLGPALGPQLLWGAATPAWPHAGLAGVGRKRFLLQGIDIWSGCALLVEGSFGVLLSLQAASACMWHHLSLPVSAPHAAVWRP